MDDGETGGGRFGVELDGAGDLAKGGGPVASVYEGRRSESATSTSTSFLLDIPAVGDDVDVATTTFEADGSECFPASDEVFT